VAWGIAKALSRLTVKLVLSSIEEEVARYRLRRDYIPVVKRLGVLVLGAFALSGCLAERNCFPTACGGPERLIPLDQDLAPIAAYDDYAHVLTRYNSEPTLEGKRSIRNDFIFERVYAMDAKYTVYEEGLTRESETEGFAAAVTNAALTGTGALIPVAQTTRLLSGIAAGLTTVDQSYSKQFLYNKAVQILQSQMRAKRSKVATDIIARSKLNVIDYPIGMAMTDLEDYYRAGTLASAFIDLSQNASTNAEAESRAKDQIKPGAQLVSQAKVRAAVQGAVITDATAPMQAFRISPPPPGPDRLTNFEATLQSTEIRAWQRLVCAKVDGRLGPSGSDTRKKIVAFLVSKNKKPTSDTITQSIRATLDDAVDNGETCPSGPN